MKKWVTIWLIPACLVLLALSVPAQVHQVENLRRILPAYPSAEIVSSSRADHFSRMTMVTDDEARAVLVFFRKAMVLKGWRLDQSERLEDGGTLVFHKKGNILAIWVRMPVKARTIVDFRLADSRP